MSPSKKRSESLGERTGGRSGGVASAYGAYTTVVNGKSTYTSRYDTPILKERQQIERALGIVAGRKKTDEEIVVIAPGDGTARHLGILLDESLGEGKRLRYYNLDVSPAAMDGAIDKVEKAANSKKHITYSYSVEQHIDDEVVRGINSESKTVQKPKIYKTFEFGKSFKGSLVVVPMDQSLYKATEIKAVCDNKKADIMVHMYGGALAHTFGRSDRLELLKKYRLCLTNNGVFVGSLPSERRFPEEQAIFTTLRLLRDIIKVAKGDTVDTYNENNELFDLGKKKESDEKRNIRYQNYFLRILEELGDLENARNRIRSHDLQNPFLNEFERYRKEQDLTKREALIQLMESEKEVEKQFFSEGHFTEEMYSYLGLDVGVGTDPSCSDDRSISSEVGDSGSSSYYNSNKENEYESDESDISEVRSKDFLNFILDLIESRISRAVEPGSFYYQRNSFKQRFNEMIVDLNNFIEQFGHRDSVIKKFNIILGLGSDVKEMGRIFHAGGIIFSQEERIRENLEERYGDTSNLIAEALRELLENLQNKLSEEEKGFINGVIERDEKAKIRGVITLPYHVFKKQELVKLFKEAGFNGSRTPVISSMHLVPLHSIVTNHGRQVVDAKFVDKVDAEQHSDYYSVTVGLPRERGMSV